MVKTRTVRLTDGRTEVLRVLSPEGLDGWSKSDPLAYEKSIVWTEDVSRLPFVRVATVDTARSRRGPLQAAGDLRVVGYAKLTANAPLNADGKTYSRRMFYVKGDDERGSDSVPQAIDPRTVLPGVAGKQPGR